MKFKIKDCDNTGCHHYNLGYDHNCYMTSYATNPETCKDYSNRLEKLGYASPPSQGVQNGGRWTKIEDEEPPEMGAYIVFNGQNVTTANWDKYGFYKVSPGGSYKVNVEQWMSLPDAP